MLKLSLDMFVDERHPKSRGNDAAIKLGNPIHGPHFEVKLGSSPLALSVVNGLCLRSVRLVLAVSANVSACIFTGSVFRALTRRTGKHIFVGIRCRNTAWISL